MNENMYIDTLNHLFISGKLYSYNFVIGLHKKQLCLLNSNVKCRSLENCSFAVTKLRPIDITSVGLIDYTNN